MELRNRKGAPITSLDEWATLASPAAVEHWKPARSAYELARDWTEGDAEQAVVALLSERPEFVGIELCDGTAEKRTQFDQDPHGPRNHDLLVRARIPGEQVVTVGVEGKADEPFDDPLWRYREKGLRRSKDTGALRRIDRMVRLWFETSLRADRTEPPLICMGYQLFSALAGTLADAKTHGSSSRAVLLVIEYVTELTDDAEHEHNARMLDAFLARLVGPQQKRTTTATGWITAPVGVRAERRSEESCHACGQSEPRDAPAFERREKRPFLEGRRAFGRATCRIRRSRGANDRRMRAPLLALKQAA